MPKPEKKPHAPPVLPALTGGLEAQLSGANLPQAPKPLPVINGTLIIRLQ